MTEYEDKRPTERAADYFSIAINKGYLAGSTKSLEHLGWAVNNTAAGLYQMNRGLHDLHSVGGSEPATQETRGKGLKSPARLVARFDIWRL